MASASLSAIAGAILSPILPQVALDKLITCLWDYLSTDHPSSSGEAANLQQLQNEWEALEDANQKLKTMQIEAKRLLKKDKQNVKVVGLLKKLNDIGYEIQDLESDMEYMELQRKVEEINQAEAHTSQSKGLKRWFTFPWAKGQSSEKRRRLSSSESLKLPLVNANIRRGMKKTISPPRICEKLYQIVSQYSPQLTSEGEEFQIMKDLKDKAYRTHHVIPSQELEQMKETAKQMQLPPIYTGKWATASEKEVQKELEKGTPYTYCFRVPKEGRVKIEDIIRGEEAAELLKDGVDLVTVADKVLSSFARISIKLCVS